MKILVEFVISGFQQIHITINGDAKVNTYGYETDGLHIFDEVEVKYIHSDKKIVLASDIARYAVEKFGTSLEKSLKNELPLDESLTVGKVGYFFSKKKYTTTDQSDGSEKKHDIFQQHWVWSSPTNIQTWLYSANNKIYLEISPTYPWLFSDPEEGEVYISFDEYKDNYKPIALVELQESRVLSWINDCDVLLQKMEVV